MTIAVVAEKPSVGRDLAKVLGATKSGQGYLHGNGYVVTWAVGHLVTIAEPHHMNERWKKWRLNDLPMLPQNWKLNVYEKLKDQFEIVNRILVSANIAEVICATDAGREGELIFRYIYETTGCQKPVKRLWISSLTPEAIQAGFKGLKPGANFDHLADAARARSRADWLVGLNLSRYYSLTTAENYSVGRVQTPTLAMVVERELAIQKFVPEEYAEIHLKLKAPAATDTFFSATVVDPQSNNGVSDKDADSGSPNAPPSAVSWASAKGRRFQKQDEKLLKDLVRELKGLEQSLVHWRQAKTTKIPPPQFFDLTELQRQANRLYGYSAQDVLGFAQALYEQRKLITYPRTDSRHLSADIAQQLPRVIDKLREAYPSEVGPALKGTQLSKRFVDDTQVTDHHAIIPTAVAPRLETLPEGERRIYDLIARRVLAAWHPDHVVSITHVVTRYDLKVQEPLFALSTGSVIEQEGWKVVDARLASVRAAKRGKKKADGEAAKEDDRLSSDAGASLPAGLLVGVAVGIAEAKVVDKTTRPPQRLTDATLLSAMESAGKSLTDKRLSDAMRERGLGTPATRASIIEVLIDRKYMHREGKNFHATDKGIKLISLVDEAVKSPEMTGTWEARLKDMEKGKEGFDPFMKDVENYLRDLLKRPVSRSLVASPSVNRSPTDANGSVLSSSPHRLRIREVSAEQHLVDPELVLRNRFGHDHFLPFQKEAIRDVVEGKNVLLVMPTGAGKSLCYQLPPLLRGKPAVVVSPLVALMEDQVTKLRKTGVRALALHGGMTREQSREICIEFLKGNCDALYVTPERLGVPGFPQMLAKAQISLVAIDEAHCISQWGHDFRPDYRMIHDRLRPLGAVQLVAVTATATPEVQRDIMKQLGRPTWSQHLHGFWRKNLALEMNQVPAKERLTVIRKVLQRPEARPAIVYVSSRRLAEEWADELGQDYKVAAYHAGMDSQARFVAQSQFLAGQCEVVVATIAFGMGVDKSNIRTVCHGAMPASIEAYYQEVGRAGRDGEPSRCLLLWSAEDLRTHEFHIGRDYPPVEVLEKIQAAVRGGEGSSPDGAIAGDTLRQMTGIEEEVFAKALEKLWLHGAIQMSGDNAFVRGVDGWASFYLEQRDRRVDRMRSMVKLCQTNDCRMVVVTSYFGDSTENDAKTCGKCDVCDPGTAWGISGSGKSKGKAKAGTAADAMVLSQEGRYQMVRLKQWRKSTSEAEAIPAYRVLNNGTLDELVRLNPRTLDQLKSVKGIGPKLLERYGDTLLELLHPREQVKEGGSSHESAPSQ